MARTLRGLALLVGVASAGAMAAAQTPQQFPTPPTPQHPVFRAGATLVAVDVYPTRDGQIVPGLTPSDFEVREDGKPQKVEFFEFLKFEPNPAVSERHDPQTAEDGERLVGDPHHRAFVAYFDTYHLYTGGARNMREPVVEFLNRTIGSTDYFAAMNPDTPVSALTFGQQTDTLAAEVDRYWPIAAKVEQAYLPISEHEQWLQHCFGSRYVGTEVLDPIKRDEQLMADLLGRWRMDLVFTSLTELTAKLTSIREERTNVLLFADGWHITGQDDSLLDSLWPLQQFGLPTGGLRPRGFTGDGATSGPSAVPDVQACDQELSRLAQTDFGLNFHKLLQDALRRNVAFYTIEPDGLAVFGEDLTTKKVPTPWNVTDDDLDNLREVALDTNGQWIIRTNDIRTPLLALSATFSSYYLLGYYTTNTNLDGKYRTIEVKVKTPGVKVTARHGYIATPNALTTSTSSANAPPTADTTALGALTRLDNAEPVSVGAVASPGELSVVAQVTDAQASSVTKGADLRVSVTSADAPAPLTATGHIAAGTQSALIHVPVGQTTGPWQVTAVVSSADGDLTGSVSVPKLAAGLVSEPMLYRASPSPRSPLWPVAAPLFSRTERLHLEWITSGPLDNRVGRLLDRRGQPLAVAITLTEPPASTGPTKLVGDVSLAPLAPGDYLVELVVGRGGVTERHLVAFRIGS